MSKLGRFLSGVKRLKNRDIDLDEHPKLGSLLFPLYVNN